MKSNNIIGETVEMQTTFGANQRNLLKLVKSSPLGMIAIDPQGAIQLWNRAAEEITGWHEEEVLGRDFRLLVDHWLLNELEDAHRHVLGGEVIHSRPIHISRKDGQTIIISYSSAPVFDDDCIIAAIAVIYDITEKINMETALRNSLEKMNRVVDETVSALAAAIGKRDPYTAGHQQRVAQFACAIAEELGGFDDDRMKGLRMAATIHDIGKLYVPAEILAKPGQLSEPEFMLIKTHPQAGFDILGEIEFPWPIARIVQQHHERLDGRGYPLGLTGEAILMEARIIGVADVVEAMSSHRPYRPSRGIEAALHEIKIGRGNIYDANTVDACVALFSNGYMLRDEQP